MNKIYSRLKGSVMSFFSVSLFLLVLTNISLKGFGQTTLLTETFGTTAGTFPIGWTSSNTTNGFASVTTAPSTSYAGVSGSVNARFINTGANGIVHTLTYANNLSTSGYSNITVLWGARATATFSQPVIFQWSNDGITWNTVIYTQVVANAWGLVNSGTRIILPVGASGVSNLSFRFSITSNNNGNYQVDDFTVEGTVVSCSTPTISSANLASTICNNGSAVINMSGLVANSAGNKIDYTINGVAQTQITGVNADASGNASFTTTALTTANNGQTLQITGITNGTCNTAFTQNVTLVVAALPAAPIATTVTGTNPSCGSTTLNVIVPAAGETYYWQGTTALGTSTVNPTSATYTVPLTGTYYVRSQNNTTFCWSAASSLLVTINVSPTITVQPTNQTVSTSATATFSVTATNAVSYQWQVNTGSGFTDIVGATLSSYTTGATATNMNGYTYKCIVTGAVGCGNITTTTATLTVTSTPCITANFDAATTIPVGWAGNSSYDVVASHYLSAPNCRSLGATKDLITPVANNPISISFYVDASNSGGQIGTLEYSTVGQAGPWTSISTFTATTVGAVLTFPLTSAPNLSATPNVFFRISSAANTIYIDDLNVYCGSGACTLPTTIGSFLPLTGPVGTLVTITGSGFVPTSAVKFGTIVSSALTYVNATTLIAEVPAGVSATSTISTSNAAGCYSNGFGSFTLINATGSCSNSDLFISEIYDAVTGNNHYIEIYNGTGNTINLDAPDYELNVLNKPSGSTTTWDISGTILPGQVKVYYGGTNGGLATGTQSGLTTGFNDGFDEIRLLKGGVILDRVIAPDELGYTIKRSSTVSGPNATYTAAEWTVLSTETIADIGLYTSGTIALSISTQPIDQTCNFSMTVVGAGIPTTYQWKYYNTTTNTWDNVTSAAFAQATIPANGVGSPTNATLTITGDVASYLNYQFYCEIGKPGCTKASNAAQFLYSTKAYYRSKASGPWTAIGSWEMADAIGGPYVSTCTFPISINSDFVIILNGHKITHNTNFTFSEDNLDIQAGGELEIETLAHMQFQNYQAGPDLQVNGTLTDRGVSPNGIAFATGATWLMGANATIIKTATSSTANYRDFYDVIVGGGISNIPATANWIYRFNGDALTTSVIAVGMFYPNLTYESTNGFHDAIGASEKFSGSTGFATVKGNFDVGGTGSGTVTLYNENTNAQAMLINGNLTIRTGSTLNNGAVTNGTGFEVKGNITVDGTFNVNGNNNGTLTLSGAAAQTIGGSNALANNMNVQNCIISNTVGIIENKDFNIFGTNTFAANAKLDFGTGNISLKSTATNTANVAQVPPSAIISYTGAGRFIIERYLFGKKAWRLLATPVDSLSSPSIFNSWQEAGSLTSTGYGTQVSGPFGGTGLDYNTLRGSLKWFDTTAQNYKEITNTNDILARSQGYYVFIRGDRASGLSGTGTATNLRIKGKINTGTQPLYPVNNFATFGNPYPSAIDFRNVSKTTIADAFIVWNPNSAGAYNVGAFETYTLVGSDYIRIPGGDVRDTIQSGEAVFIQSIGGGSITIEENDKVNGSRNVSRGGNAIAKVNATTPTLDINLFAKNVNGSMYLADGVKLNFDNNYSNGIDNDDVRKILNTADNLFIKNSNAKLVVERRNILQNTDTIFLQLTGTRVANYRFEIAASFLNNTGLEAFLKDKFLRTETAVNLENVTDVNFDITADAASKTADRFMIVFKQALPLTKFISINAFTNTDKTNAILWSVSNENKVTNYSIERSVNGIDFVAIKNNAALQNNNTTVAYSNSDAQPLLNDNYYRIKMLQLNGNIVYSNMVKVVKINNEIGISISPNPVTNKTIHLQMMNQPKGFYSLRLLNNIGQTIYNGSVEVTSYLQTKNIALNKNTTVGNYELIIVNAAGEKAIKKITIAE